MFQDFALFPHLTNLANVMFGLKSLPRGRSRARGAAARSIASGSRATPHAYPHMLSGGEQQRVALARAVAPRPSVLLMDEPFSGLDRRLRDEVRDETLNVLRESRVTCIVVTHDPEEAMRIADRIALMRAGRLVQVGTPETIYTAAARSVRGALLLRAQRDCRRPCAAGMRETAARRFRRARPARGQRRRWSRSARRALRLAAGGHRPRGHGSQHRRFLGEVDLVEIAVDGLDGRCKARVLRERRPAVNE